MASELFSLSQEGNIPLESVIITPLLRERPPRSPDYEAENRALATLAREMANSPETVLQKLVEIALELSRAHSAGISLLEEQHGQQTFRWSAVAGQCSEYLGATIPRELSPCGAVLDRNSVLLFSHPERYFLSPLLRTSPAVVEALLIPFHVAEKPVGTIWVIAHDQSRQFDAEDERLMRSLGNFASSSYQVLKQVDALKEEVAERKRTEEALRRSEATLQDFVANATIGIHFVAGDGTIIWANQTQLDLLGNTLDEYIGHQIAEFHVDSPVIKDILDRLRRGELVRDHEARLRCKDGSFATFLSIPPRHSKMESLIAVVVSRVISPIAKRWKQNYAKASDASAK